MTGPRVTPDPARDFLSLSRVLTPEEFHQASMMSPTALATPGIFPLLPPLPKTEPPPKPSPDQQVSDLVNELPPSVRDLARYGLQKAHAVAAALKYPFQHPLDFALGIVKAPGEAYTTAFSPAASEVDDLNSPTNPTRMALEAKYGPLTETQQVTPRERTVAGIQTAANVAAPYLSPMFGGAVAGAAYNPDDPVSGAIAGAIFGKGIDLAVKGAGAALGSKTATPLSDPSAGEPLKSPATGSGERTPLDQRLADQYKAELEASRQAARSYAQKLRMSWQTMTEGAPEMAQAKGIIRATTGAAAAQYEQAAFKLDEFRRAVHRLPDQGRLDFIDAIETGNHESIDPEFRPLADDIRKTLDDARDRIQELGTGKLDHFIEDYFPHIWADPDEAATVMRSIGGKAPFEGPASFLKQRTIPTIKEGIEQGLQPLTTNPIDLTLLKLREMNRYLMAHQSLNALKDAGLVHYVDYARGGSVPDGYAPINDKIAMVFGPRQGAVSVPSDAAHLTSGAETEGPGLAPVTPEDVTVYGRRIMGQYFAPEPVAKLLDNYYSPGLPQTLKNWFPGPTGRALAMTTEAWRGLGNTLNQAQLGLSGFHLGMTSLDATVSRTALGMQYLAEGKPWEGFNKIVQSPMAAFPGIVSGINHAFGGDLEFGLGAKIRAAYLDPSKATPEMVMLANAVKEAGGRIGQDSFYTNSIVPTYFDLLRQEWQALKAGNYAEAAAKDFQAGNRAIPALFELVTKPLMEHIVPLQKLQVFGEQAQRILADLEHDASLTERRGALQEAWDSTDNRMGQLVYDNLFWNKTFKELAMLSTRSVGWNLGTIRELGGGAVDLATIGKQKRLTPAAAYALALPMTVGAYGALYQYLRTGDGPQELKDYFYPRTGDVDADGNPERVQLPSYMKDLFSYSQHPFRTVTHKVSPLPSALWDMMANQDYYGDEIRNPHDPFVQQLQQEAAFIAKTLTPFGIRNAVESAKRGDSRVTQVQSEVGITPAPREVVRGPGQNLMAEYQAERRTSGATPEQVEARQARAQILAGLRGNTGVDLEKAVNDALSSGQITPPEIARLMKRAGMTPAQEKFRGLPLNEALDVFKVSDEREKALFAELLAKKIEKANR